MQNLENEILDREALNTFTPVDLWDRLKIKKWRMNNLYYIVDEFGKTIPFHLNFIQEQIFNSQGKKRIILKYRQWWVSTYKIIDLLDDVLFWWSNRTNYFVTHRQDLLDEFFKKAKLTFDTMEKRIKILASEPDTDNANEMYWKDTNNTLKISLDIRWKTPSKMHISEFAWKSRDDQAKLFLAMEQFRETQIDIESTANWMWDVFHSLCMNSKNWLWEYKLLFYPFDIEDRNELEPPKDFVPNEEEQIFYDSFLTKYPKEVWYRKLFWRKTKIETANALWEDWPMLFRQENPISIEDAFVSSWAMVFDMTQQYKVVKHYKEIEWFKLFLPPTDKLVIGIDIAEWWVKGDYCAISAKRTDWRTVFQYKWKVNEVILAQKLDFILNYEEDWKKYMGTILPENNTGLAFINECKKYDWFQYVLKSRNSESVSDENLQQKYWFRTTAKSKDLLIRDYRWALYRWDIDVSEAVYWEMHTYIFDKNNRPNAVAPNHDDLLMADMIAYNGVKYEPFIIEDIQSDYLDPDELEWLPVMERFHYKLKHPEQF